jgi:hypothetical protein
MEMKIPVMFINGSLGAVCVEDLDEMIDKNVILAFQRSTGLAIVGKDEVRSRRLDGQGSWRNRKNNMIIPDRILLVSAAMA